MAALICTHSDEELKELLVPELANRITACEEPFKVWFRRFWLTGARFDSAAWARKVSTGGGLHTTKNFRQIPTYIPAIYRRVSLREAR